MVLSSVNTDGVVATDPLTVARCRLDDSCRVDYSRGVLLSCPPPSGSPTTPTQQRNEQCQTPETSMSRAPVTKRVSRSVTPQEAGETRFHALVLPPASRMYEEQPHNNSQLPDDRDSGGNVENFRSCAHTISRGVLGSAGQQTRRGSPIASPLFQGRKPGARGKVPRFGELQIGVGYGDKSKYCSVAPLVHTVLSTIAEEAVSIPVHTTLSTTANEAVSPSKQVLNPVEPVATPVSPGLFLQKRTHIHSIGKDNYAPPLPEVSDAAIWLPVWQVSCQEDVDASHSQITVPDFLSEFQKI